MRNTHDAVNLGWLGEFLVTHNHWPRNIELCHGAMCVGRSIPNCHTEEVHSLAIVFFIHRLDVWNLAAAWSTPTCPEVNHCVGAFTHIVAQFHGSAIFFCDGEIGEHLTFCRYGLRLHIVNGIFHSLQFQIRCWHILQFFLKL